MNRYQFERVFKYAEREFGKLPKNSMPPEEYMDLLRVIESNAMYVHGKDPTCDSLSMGEALALALHQIQARCRGVSVESLGLEEFRTPRNAPLEHAILYAFDPFTNDAVRDELDRAGLDPGDMAVLKAYYRGPALCCCRLKDSQELYQGAYGYDGYFRFLSHQGYFLMSGLDGLEYTVFIPPELK